MDALKVATQGIVLTPETAGVFIYKLSALEAGQTRQLSVEEVLQPSPLPPCGAVLPVILPRRVGPEPLAALEWFELKRDSDAAVIRAHLRSSVRSTVSRHSERL